MSLVRIWTSLLTTVIPATSFEDNQLPSFQVASQKLFERSRRAIPASYDEISNWFPATAKSLMKSECKLFAVDHGESADMLATSHLATPPSRIETYIMPLSSNTFQGCPAGQLLVALACSRVHPVPAVLSVKIPDSLSANNSPLLATWALLQAPPEGSTGKSEFQLVSSKLTE